MPAIEGNERQAGGNRGRVDGGRAPLPGTEGGSAAAWREAFANSLREELAHLGVDVGVGYFSWIATDLVAGADGHPAASGVRAELPGPLGKTYPVEQAGEAVAEGIATRRRWVVVPPWARALLLLRGVLGLLMGRGSRALGTADLEARFLDDVERRGADASAPVGPAGWRASAQ